MNSFRRGSEFAAFCAALAVSSPAAASVPDAIGAPFINFLGNPNVRNAMASVFNAPLHSAAIAAGVHPAVAAQLASHPSASMFGGGLPSAVSPAPMRAGQVLWGIDSGATINAAASATITVQPQQRCIPTTLSLTSGMADGFIIGDIRVGVKPALITTGSISAALFVQNSTMRMFTRYMLEVGTNFSVTVTNITGGALRFVATGLGDNAERNDGCY